MEKHSTIKKQAMLSKRQRGKNVVKKGKIIR